LKAEPSRLITQNLTGNLKLLSVLLQDSNWNSATPLSKADRNFTKGHEERCRTPLASEALLETCTACFYSNQNTDKTDAMLRFRNRLIVMLANCLSFGIDYRKTLLAQKLALERFVLEVRQ